MLSKPSRLVATIASLLTLVTSIAFSPVAAQATEVVSSTGSCVANVDNTSGVTTYDDGTYCYVAFKSTGITYTWTRPGAVTNFDMLVVAGGGSGAVRHAGGGGAGGLIQLTNQSVTAANISVVVGAGGAATGAQGVGAGAEGANGGNSSVTAAGFTTQNAIGGGAGSFNVSPSTGGSGGGGGTNYSGAASSASGQGNSGGAGFNSGASWYGGGGGGGAGTAGGNSTNATSTTAGSGGSGVAVSWISTAARNEIGAGVVSGNSVYFAGGGGGSTSSVGTGGTGGLGGGGAGGSPGQVGTAGAANSGAGGGAGAMNSSGNTSNASGAGGSGVVVFRYAKQTPVLSWNASDINSYENPVSTTAINDLSSSSNLDGTLYSGTNSVAPTFTNSTGAWNFTGGASSVGPYAKTNSSINTTAFATHGMTIDFEADFGAAADNWERIIDFSSNADASNNILLARAGVSNDLWLEIWNGAVSAGGCRYTGAIPVNSGMNRWTVSIDGTNCRMWKNGSLVYTVAYTGKPSAGINLTNNLIAKSNWSSDNSFEGSIRSLRIFTGGLSASEIPAPNNKTVTFNAYDGNTQNGGGVTNNMSSPRLTSGTVRLPTPITRAGYTFMGWFDATTFANKVGNAGDTYTPSTTTTLYAGWRTSIDSSALSSLVFNFDATHIDSLPVAATSAASVYPASSRILATAVGGLTRDTANSPGAASFANRSYLNFGANNAANVTTTAITVETWFKCNSYRGAGWNIIATHWFSDTAGNSSTAMQDWHFGIYNHHLQLNTGSSSQVSNGSYTFSSSDCNGTKWMLLGFTFDASGNVQFYINGRADGAVNTGKSRQPNTSAILELGEGRDAYTYLGYMSRFRIYNAALSSTQMLNNFGGEATTYGMGPYNLTYATGPNGSGSNIVDTYNAGTSVTLKNNDAPFTRAGYYISGWTTSSTSGAAQTHALAANVSMDAALTLYPVWTATTYTITYDYNGATGGNSPGSATYSVAGSAITLPTPTKTSYTFAGWWSTSTFDTGTQVTGTQTPSSSYTLYAKWTLVTYTITFKANDGLSTADITQTVTSGVPVALRTNTFTKTHSVFRYWSDISTGLSMNAWTDGQSITPTSNLTLYVIWADNAHAIWDSNGGTAIADSWITTYGLPGYTGLVKPANPTLAGKTFGGWSTSETSNNGDLENVVNGWPRDYESGTTETFYAIWLDECAPTKTTFVGTGTSNNTLSTYGTNGVKYVQLKFTNTAQCVFTVPAEVTSYDALMVAGGGAGSYFGRAGGGGAGTVLNTNVGGVSATAGAKLPVKVGSGGAFVYNATNGSRGENGGKGVFGDIVVYGGGAGAGGIGSVQMAGMGGSSGGGSCTSSYDQAGGIATQSFSGWSIYTNFGGASLWTCNTAGGAGGGGAGGSGTHGNAGGTGGASITRFGLEIGGGGAGWQESATAQGGGTVGGDWTNSCPAAGGANNGAAYTGSGGASCGSGGSGVLVVRYAAPTYTVTYNYNSATGGNSTASEDSIATQLTLPTPTRTGYTFGGWYAEAGLTNLVGNAGAGYTPTADTALYAKWTGGTYTLTYSYNGATGGNGTTSASYTTGGTAITLPTPTKTNYTFGGWYAEAGFTTLISGTQTPSADATLYAKWTGVTYTLTYTYNGATGNSSTVSSGYITGGTAITLPAPTKTGYTFGGWYAEAGLTTLVSGAQTPSADATLYAKWNANTYTLSYTYNGATGGNGTASANYTTGGTAITLPTPTRTGYTFGGWYAEVGMSTLVSGTQTPTASATLYAKWNANNYTLTYTYNGATGGNGTASSSYTSGGTGITLPTPTKTGYSFGGWYAENTYVNLISGTQTPSADATIFAKWTANTYTLTYTYNGATGANSTVSSAYTTGGTAITLPTPTRTGYTFGGWYAEVGLSTAVTGTQSPSADATLYAKWNANNYTLTYSYNGATGGNGTPSSVYTTGGAGITLPTPTKTNYTFAGWYSEAGFTNQVTGTQTPSADATLYAKWNGVTYTLTYTYNGATGGNTTASSAYITGGTAITLPNPTKTGFTFAGWYSDAGFTNQVIGAQSPVADATVYAKWSTTVYAIDFAPNYGVQVSSTTNVAIGSATILPTPTRANFVFDGWWSAATGGVKIGNAGASYTPGAAVTLYARWIQSSLYGVVNNLNRISTITASDIVASTYSGATGGSGVSVSVPTGTLPSGTVVTLDAITDNTYAQSLLTGTNSYILSIAVSWLAPDETVPNTNNGKSIAMTITNASIRAGALIYSVQNGVATLLGTATQNGTITVQLTSDPSLYVVATVPNPVAALSNTFTTNSAVVTWGAPISDGGSAITGYMVTLSSGATCTTQTLSCTFNNLTAGTTYVATVVATNSVGNSLTSTTSFTLAGQQASGGVGGSVPVTPTPPVVIPPKPVDPLVPSVPVLVKVPLPQAVLKVLAHNVPVLAGARVISPILFKPNSAKLDATDLDQIAEAASILKDKTGWLYVTGFVKYEGKGTAIERKIASARAAVVAKQLAKLGLKVKIGYLGYGPQNKKSPKPSDRKVELRWQEEYSQKS